MRWNMGFKNAVYIQPKRRGIFSRPSLIFSGLFGYEASLQKGEDTATTLTCHVTSFFLLLCVMFLLGIQVVGTPIECWCPALTTRSQCNYTRSFCWVSKSYVIDYEDAIPREEEEKNQVQKREMSFYPLIPFFLLILNSILVMPRLLWATFQAGGGIDLVKTVKVAAFSRKSSEANAKEVAYSLFMNLRRRACNTHCVKDKLLNVISACGFFPLGSKYGTYQTGLLLLSRLLSLGAIIASFLLLGMLLDVDYAHWGWSVARDLAENGHVTDMNVFPRETLCDFEIRQLQNVHRYTVQCIMPINMWSEKIFLFLWFWLVLLCLVNLYDYQYWARKLLFQSSRRKLVKKHLLIISRQFKDLHPDHLAEFVSRLVLPDSVLLLHKLEIAVGKPFANDVILCLWKQYGQETAKESMTDSRSRRVSSSRSEDLT